MKRSRTIFTVAAVALVVGAPLGGQTPIDADTEWTFAAVGDVIMTRRLIQYDHEGDPGFHGLANLIREADVAFMNLEVALFDHREFDGWGAAENGGNYLVGPPVVLEDLVQMGFDLFNTANNHATDYGVAGLRRTMEHLEGRGLVYAGSGENLGFASRPGYLDSRVGRIALIGMASSFTTMSPAGLASVTLRGRPGINPLHTSRRIEGSPATMAALRNAARAQGIAVAEGPSDSVSVFGITVYPGATDRVVETLSDMDRQRVLAEVVNARDQADRVILNSHSHAPGNDSEVPPDWMVRFAKETIEAGATAFVIEGPHRLRGIEIHQGRPIFYSLGNFIFQDETVDPMPWDENVRYDLDHYALTKEIFDARFGVENGVPTRGYPLEPVRYETVLAVTRFRGDEAQEIRLYPVTLGQHEPRSRRGNPRLASPEDGRRIIEKLADLSRPFGTVIEYEEGIGVWRR